MKEWAHFSEARATAVEKSIEFAGRIWKPTRKLAYVKASLCHPLPVLNSKRRGFTAATLANSCATAVLQMCDFEHQLEYYGADKDAICGVIAAVEFPAKKKAVELASAGEKVPMDVLFAVWRKAAGVEAALEEMAEDDNPWRTSMECDWATESTAMWDGNKFFAWSECSSEMKKLIKPFTVEKFNDKPMALIMGGEDGKVEFSGGAFTKWPSDKEVEVDQLAANDAPEKLANKKLISMGWRSADDWREAVASEKSVQRKEEQASIIIGTTAPADSDGHVHEITMNMEILPAAGHTHYFRPVKFDPATGVMEGLTSTHGSYDSAKGRYVDHLHMVTLGGKQSSVGKADFSKIAVATHNEVKPVAR